MQCRVFIIGQMTINGRSHRSHAAAHASVGMTWLLNPAAAADARHRTIQRRHDMATGRLGLPNPYPRVTLGLVLG